MDRQRIEDALKEVTHHQAHLPEAFSMAPDGYRKGRKQVDLVAVWDKLPLEERVGLAACLIGVDNRSEPAMVIHQAYGRLCRNGSFHESDKQPPSLPVRFKK